MTRLGIQLYSVREMDASLPEIVAAVGETAFDGVELAYRYPESAPDEVAAALDAAGLEVLGAHVGLDAMESDPAELVADYEPVGCTRFALPHVPAEEFRTADSVSALANRLNDVSAALAAAGGSFCYHNQAHDFLAVGERRAFDRLVAETDDRVGFELDVGGAVAAGIDPVELLDSYGDRIPLVHAKDVVAPDPDPTSTQRGVPIGTGDVDFAAVAAAAERAGVEWLVYENDEPENPAEALERGAETLADAAE